ncbi:MAG: glycogen debranching enzyme GlgX [Pseudomonadota bacterium]|jgi:glycogen operon protein
MMERGSPWPLGAEVVPQGVNVAVWAPDATRLEVCVFDADGTQELARHDLPTCTDGVWHGCLVGAAAGLVYGLRAHGPWDPAQGHRFNPAKVLLDPWAQSVVGRYGGSPDVDLSLYLGHSEADPTLPDTRDNASVALKARVQPPVAAVESCERPQWSVDRTVLCELHVRSTTMLHPDIPAALRGSYAAVAHPAMLDHWRSLGVTTLSLLPVHARADEARLQQLGLSNHWGYSSIAFLAPEPRYWSATSGTSPESECREMVRAAHAAGLEVVLDVVFNHTGETDECGPTLSMRGLANARYYHLNAERRDRYINWTGCGNCLNLAEPRVVELVLGSLRHWVQAYGVDGFRFDLAPVLARGGDGQFSAAAGFFAALQSDPVLSRIKLIAEPWDIGPGGYQLGAFPPGWSEWNDQYRDTMRAWWLRGAGDRGVFAHRFAASSAQFHHDRRQPTASVNFITAHDGFTLRDLVTYDHKHNHANGEHNRDGHHHNSSWNCGVEGPTDVPAVRALRVRLQRAMLATLLLSQGTPMLLAGDEIGHSQQGNNNAYCQDNVLSWLDWAGQDADLLATTQRLTALRDEVPALRIGHWLTGQADALSRTDVVWLHPDGHRLEGADWRSTADRALLVHLQADAGPQALLLFNPETDNRQCKLPADADWEVVFDSARAHGAPDQSGRAHGAASVVCSARSVVVLRSISQ